MRTGLALGVAIVVFVASADGREPDKQDRNTLKLRKGEKGAVLIEVTSDRKFPPINAFPELHVGAVTVSRSTYPASGDTKTLIFPVTAAQFASMKDGDPISVRYNPDGQGVWEFGKLDKKLLDK
jgi:hypothetical protein